MSFRTKLLVGSAVVVIGVILFGWISAIRTERVAQDFLLRSQALVLGKASLSDAEGMLAVFQGYRFNANPCASTDCELAFRFHNSLLSFLHLAPPTGLDSFLRFHEGVLVNRETYLGQGLCCVVYVREDLPISKEGKQRSSFSSDLQRDGNGRTWKATVHLTPEATERERGLAYSFNLHCLDKIGGCKTAQELSPRVWHEGS
jgi:hypothetical protein